MAKLFISAGHGGSDPGAVYGSRQEKNYTLQLSSDISAILRSAGHTVINNRTTDVDRDINEDARKANANGVDAVIELHLNSGGGTGTETFCSLAGGESRDLANAVNDRLSNIGFRNRGVKTKINSEGKDYYGIIRLTKAPAILIETCVRPDRAMLKVA
jgi:N-acetylmuramoyl-L-alanine amidase